MRKLLVGLISIAALGLTPFSSGMISAQDHETFIQGKWRLEGEFPKDKSGRSRVWFLEWTFADVTFLQIGYPPIKQEGKYRIIKHVENTLTLELYEQKGNFGTKDRQIEIVIDEKNKRLKIAQQDGFSRVENKK